MVVVYGSKCSAHFLLENVNFYSISFIFSFGFLFNKMMSGA